MSQDLLNKLKLFFSTQPIEKAWIFGSFARGDERPDSDLDIMATYLSNHRPGLLEESISGRWMIPGFNGGGRGAGRAM
ncbi:MAG: nucleotidyltransferase domain-containing protein [Muribaculaceae bacterium]